MSEPTTVVPLALLDGYKVRWNRDTVARDIVQNFYDAAADFDEVGIDVDEAGGRVRVTGRATFDLEYLRYLGATTKRDTRAAGGFGEGFKICALVLVRDHGADVRAGAGAWEIRPFLRPMKLGRELCYEVSRRDPAAAPAGSWVEIRGADAALCKAFTGARDMFRHPKNPRLERPLHVDDAAGVGVYFARDPKRADVFYRRQHRGSLAFPKGNGLTFAHDDRVDGVEADRDRRGLRAPGRVVAAVLSRVPTDAIERIIRHLRAYWMQGSTVLGAALREAARRGARFSFPARWIASRRHDHHLEEHARRRGLLVAVGGFAGAGMPTAADRFGEVELPRAPRAIEAARIEVARDVYASLLGEAAPRGAVRVLDVSRLSWRGGGNATILRAGVLAAPFDEGVGDVLAALARQDGQARLNNAARLTRLIEGALREAERLDGFRARWDRGALAAPAPAEDDEGDEAGDGVRRDGAPDANVAILAPRGFPPAEQIARRIRRLSRSIRVNLWLSHVTVEGPEAAADEYARGIPSVWIGDVEIEPPRGGPRYEVRTFSGAGGPSLCPADEAIESALAAIARSKNLYPRHQKRSRLSERSYLRFLRATRPEAYRQELRARAVKRAIEALAADERWSGYGSYTFVRAAVRRALDVGAPAEGALDAAAAEAAARALDRFDALSRELALDLSTLSPEDHEAVQSLLIAQAAELAQTLDLAAIPGQILPCVPRVMALDEASRDLPLDEACRKICRGSATSVLFTRAAEAPLQAAARAAEDRLEAAARVAIARHEAARGGLDAEACAGLSEALDQRFGEGQPKAPKDEADEAAERVRAAWKDAIASGASEVEAARRCLEVAEAAYGRR